MMFLNRKSHVEPMPCTTNTKWSIWAGSPMKNSKRDSELGMHVAI